MKAVYARAPFVKTIKIKDISPRNSHGRVIKELLKRLHTSTNIASYFAAL